MKIVLHTAIYSIFWMFFSITFAQSPDPALLQDYYRALKEGEELAVRILQLEKQLAAYQASKPYIKEDPLSATVRIKVISPGDSTTGSAFIMGCADQENKDGTRNCLVVTVAHAFRVAGITDPNVDLKKTPIQIQFSKKGEMINAFAPGRYVGGALQHDVDVAYVIIKVPGKMVVPIVPIASLDYQIAPNQKVTQFGYPNGTSIVEINRRIITNTTASRYIQCRGLSASGNSGGLLINANGQAIGVSSASDPQGGSECFFTSFVDMHQLAADPAIARELVKNGLGHIFKK